MASQLTRSAYTDATPRVRLLASRRSGNSRVYTLSQINRGTWAVETDAKKIDAYEHPLPRGSFIINTRDGSSKVANKELFSETLHGYEPSPRDKQKKNDEAHCFWVSAGEKGVKCNVNISGSRVGKVEWGKGKNVETVEVVTRSGPFRQASARFTEIQLYELGAQALVAITDTREALVYSLPVLDPMHTFQLIKQPNSYV